MTRRILAYLVLVILVLITGLVIQSDVDENKREQRTRQEFVDFASQAIAYLVFSRHLNQTAVVFELNNDEWRNSVQLSRNKGDLDALIQQSQDSIMMYGDLLFPDLTSRAELETAITQGIEISATSKQIQDVQGHHDALSNALASYETAHDNWALEQVMLVEGFTDHENPPTSQHDFPVKIDYDNRARELLQRYGCGDVELSWDASYLPGVNDSGAAAAWDNIIYLNPDMPADRLDYASAHECAHILQYRAYGNTLDGWYALEVSMNSIYEGTGYFGLEQNADCITQEWGYTNTHYTQSCEGVRGEKAREIINHAIKEIDKE